MKMKNEFLIKKNTKSHKCTTCKQKYPCTADECDEPYHLQCTPCEIKQYEMENKK